ncbi:hypothetical protein UG55_103145 [Frankia sp. EI5c]|uniref:DUF6542 domain-containing protein n=1 Tax=Frankia sp. EI5c TaxID=683316 RepID=UPI0007C3CDBB|nr:DUF6542 domain-containing protein [Frankia sp. EI5c]OAA24198.1 hypothetical protein UG55_103145 [Frankia sp. EI5c]
MPDDAYPYDRARDGSPPPATVVTGTRRGLSALGAALLVVVAGGLGAVIDSLLFDNLRYVFGVLFVASCVVAALRAHVDDLIGVVIMPPLAYAVITIIVGYLNPEAGDGSTGLRNRAIDVGSEMILHAPVLLAAVILVAVIAAVRGRRAQIARRERQRSLAQSAAARRRRPV